MGFIDRVFKFSRTLFSPCQSHIRNKYEFFSKLFSRALPFAKTFGFHTFQFVHLARWKKHFGQLGPSFVLQHSCALRGAHGSSSVLD